MLHVLNTRISKQKRTYVIIDETRLIINRDYLIDSIFISVLFFIHVCLHIKYVSRVIQK